MENINLSKQVFDRDSFNNTIDTSFTQLVQPTSSLAVTSSITVEQFFQEYQQLFFDIPKFGEINSHEYLVKTSGAYIGTTTPQDEVVQALIDEITQLRQDNLDLQQQISNIQLPTGQL